MRPTVIVTNAVWSLLCVSLRVFLLVMSVSHTKHNEPIELGAFCDVESCRDQRKRILGGFPHGNWHFWGSYLVMPALARARYSQPYSQVAAAMRSLATNTVATCSFWLRHRLKAGYMSAFRVPWLRSKGIVTLIEQTRRIGNTAVISWFCDK